MLKKTKFLNPEPFHRICATVSEKSLLQNYQAIRDQVKQSWVLPMIKANAYGHGDAWAANVLKNEPHLFGFGVATLEEGAKIRESLGAKGRKTRIIVVSGATVWSEAKAEYCERFRLTPVISTLEDWQLFLKQKDFAHIPYHLKFNTGMNRLGLPLSEASRIHAQLKKFSPDELPEGIASHLAVAENADHSLTQNQIERFKSLKKEFTSTCPNVFFHLANSAAIWNNKKYQLDAWTEIVRPGVSLYGIPPWANAPARGLSSVLTLKTQVIAKHFLKAGESVGYGATYRVEAKKHPQGQWVAICAGGYADGLLRSLSNKGTVFLGNHHRRVLGIISMDLSAVECDASIKVGDWVEWLGKSIDPWTQAQAAGTIPYELYTSISPRVWMETE